VVVGENMVVVGEGILASCDDDKGYMVASIGSGDMMSDDDKGHGSIGRNIATEN